MRTQGAERTGRIVAVEPTSSGAWGKLAVDKSAAREGEDALRRGSSVAHKVRSLEEALERQKKEKLVADVALGKAVEAVYRKLEEHQKQFVEVLAQDNAR